MPNLFSFIILGIVQGLTEALPISSSGHLVIFQELLNVDIPGLSFEAFINFGSTLMICIFFRDSLKELIIGFFGFIGSKGKKYQDEWQFVLKIIVATLPLVFAGLLMVITNFDMPETINSVGYALFVTAAALYFVNNKRGTTTIAQMTYKQAAIIGCFQVIALMPGLSRSGMTLVGALLIGIDNREAFNFSFIMFIPASLGALIFSVLDMVKDPQLSTYLPGYITSFILATIFTYFGLVLTRKFVVGHKLQYFSIYCVVVASIITVTSFI